MHGIICHEENIKHSTNSTICDALIEREREGGRIDIERERERFRERYEGRRCERRRSE